MGKLIYEDLTYRIRGSLFRVYNALGPGYREETYRQALMRSTRIERIERIRGRLTASRNEAPPDGSGQRISVQRARQ